MHSTEIAPALVCGQNYMLGHVCVLLPMNMGSDWRLCSPMSLPYRSCRWVVLLSPSAAVNTVETRPATRTQPTEAWVGHVWSVPRIVLRVVCEPLLHTHKPTLSKRGNARRGGSRATFMSWWNNCATPPSLDVGDAAGGFQGHEDSKARAKVKAAATKEAKAEKEKPRQRRARTSSRRR